MTKKDYVKFAEVLRVLHKNVELGIIDTTDALLAHTTLMIADVFTSDNSRFDLTRFLEACKKETV